jgi:serine/threonine protein kinase
MKTRSEYLHPDIRSWEVLALEKGISYSDTKPEKGKFAQVYMASRLEPNPDSNDSEDVEIAVKSQQIRDPSNSFDASYRELMIFKELASLKSENSCDGFVTMYDWFKTDGDDKTEGKQYMNFVLEKADETLRQHLTRNKEIPLARYKSILFQILYALSVAQKKYQFVHHDLHLKNIMLKKLPENIKKVVFCINPKCYVSNEDFVVKITDFGLSRITLPTKEVIHNPKTSPFFDPSIDLNQIVHEFRVIKIVWPDDMVDDEKQNLKNLRQILSKATLHVDFDGLIRHPFFASMTRDAPSVSDLSMEAPTDTLWFGEGVKIKKEASGGSQEEEIVRKTQIRSREKWRLNGEEVFHKTIVKSRLKWRKMNTSLGVINQLSIELNPVQVNTILNPFQIEIDKKKAQLRLKQSK